MTDEVKAEVSATDEIFNKPVFLIIEGKNVELRRISVDTLEIATTTILKMVMLFQPNKPIFSFVEKGDVAVLREVIVSCSNLTSKEVTAMSATGFFKLVDKWLELNTTEIAEISKLFLSIRGKLQIAGTELLKQVNKK